MFPGHQALYCFLSYIYTRTMWLTLNYRNSISSHIKTCANNQNHQIVIHNACHYFSLHDSFSVLTRWVWYRLLLPLITSSLLFNVREIKDYKTYQAHKFRVPDHFVLSTFKSSCWLCTKMLQLISLWIFFPSVLERFLQVRENSFHFYLSGSIFQSRMLYEFCEIFLFFLCFFSH